MAGREDRMVKGPVVLVCFLPEQEQLLVAKGDRIH